jgi:hypothetical protein
MSERGIVMFAWAARPPAYRGTRNHVSGVRRCATCKGNRNVRRFDHAGFCGVCLDRSRVDDDDDLGGEG